MNKQNTLDIEEVSTDSNTPVKYTPPRLKWFTVLATLLVLALIAICIIAAIYLPEIAIFVPILAIGLALAL